MEWQASSLARCLSELDSLETEELEPDSALSMEPLRAPAEPQPDHEAHSALARSRLEWAHCRECPVVVECVAAPPSEQEEDSESATAQPRRKGGREETVSWVGGKGSLLRKAKSIGRRNQQATSDRWCDARIIWNRGCVRRLRDDTGSRGID